MNLCWQAVGFILIKCYAFSVVLPLIHFLIINSEISWLIIKTFINVLFFWKLVVRLCLRNLRKFLIFLRLQDFWRHVDYWCPNRLWNRWYLLIIAWINFSKLHIFHWIVIGISLNCFPINSVMVLCTQWID